MTLPENIELIFRGAWSWPALAAALGAAWLILARWSRPAREILGPGWGRSLLALKLLAAAMLLGWAANPRLRYLSSRIEDAAVAIALDSSLSMAARDALDQERYGAARDLLIAGRNPIGRALGEKMQVEYYLFDRGLKSIEPGAAPPRPNPAGSETNYPGALRALAAEARAKRLRAVVWASDGNNNAPGDLRKAALDLGLPIHAIAFGQRDDPANPWRDLGIERIEAPTRANRGQEVEVKMRLRQEGMEGRTLEVEAREHGERLASAPLQISAAPAQTVSLVFTPEGKGTHTIEFAVPRLEGDRLVENDTARLSIAVADRELKVLYVEGSLRWSYKFLKRMLETEETLLADCVIRTGGAQLYQQGASALKFRKGLPADYEGLASYDLIVLGDFPRSFLDDPQLEMLGRWVSEDKGGLLLIGGEQTLASGDYIGSPLETLMPAPFRQQTLPREPAPSSLALTAAGAASGAMGGLETVLPRISVPLVYRLGDPKPGAETWIEAQGGSAAGHPVLIAQRYGQGRTMLLASDGLWQLAMREGGARTESPSARFWLQILNWLAQVEDKGDENDPVLTASADRSFYVSEQEVHLSATLRKPPRDGLELAVRGEVLFEGESLALLQFPEPNAVRRAELTWKPPHDGRFVFRLTGQAGDAEQTLDIEACVGRPFAERERNALNETTLRTMARESGGRYYTQLNARDVVGQIEADTASATKLVELDLLDSPAVFAAFCLAVCLEWILRRRRNLI